MLSMDPLLCWLLGADAGGARGCAGLPGWCNVPSRCWGHGWVPINNADNNKISWGQAVAGFIDSQPKIWLSAEVSAPSLDKGHLQFLLCRGLGTGWLLPWVFVCLRARRHRQANPCEGAVVAAQTSTLAGNAAFGQLNPILCSYTVG